MNRETYDVVVVGGGIMGSAVAYYLKRADVRLDVAVVEMDPTYSKASTTLSMANVRSQFSFEKNTSEYHSLPLRCSRISKK